jgi:hypothetical protein
MPDEDVAGATEKRPALTRARDAATSIGLRGPRRPPPGQLDSPRAEPELDDLLAGAEDLASPPRPGAPWTATKGDAHYRLYDLAELDEAERRRVAGEASVGLALGELPGVVPTTAVDRRGEWLVIEGPRLSRTLADHLATGPGARWGPEEYADAIRTVSRILQRAHDRGLVHLDLRPERIGWGTPGETPRLADFPIGGFDDDLAPDPYVAQERFLGERGPSVDQYALGVIAHEIFTAVGAPRLTEPVRRAIARAAATDPADRFATVAEFGDALRIAVAAEAPRGLADRLGKLSPPKRAGFGAAIAAGLATSVADTVIAPGSAEPAATMLLTNTLAMGLFGAFVFAAVALATRIRGNRRLLSFRILSRPIVQLAICVALVALAAHGGGEINDAVPRSALIVFPTCALFSRPRSNVGETLVLAGHLWDRHLAWAPPARRAASAVVVVALGLIAGAPALAKTFFDDFEFRTISAAEFSPLTPVWNLRTMLAKDDTDGACDEVMSVAADRDPSLCRQLAHIAAGVQASEPVRQARWDFAVRGPLDQFRVQEIPAPPNHRVWNLLTPDHEVAGTMYTTGPEGKQVVVVLSRLPAHGMSTEMRQSWLYEVAWNGREYRVAEYRACTVAPPGTGKPPADCIVSSDATRAELEAAIGAKGARPGG